jgi:hypothetical protein
MYDTVNNPIPRNNIYSAPTLAQIEKQIQGFSGEQRDLMYKVFVMTMDACNELVENEILSKEIFA